jgi:hypothetical protein
MAGFYVNLPVGGVFAVLIALIRIPYRIIKNKNTSALHIIVEKFDLLGFAIFAPAAIQILLALEWGGHQYSWSSATVIGLLCGAAGTFCLFLTWEYRQGDIAIIPLSMVRQRIVWSSCLVMSFFTGGFFILSYYLPIYFQAVRGAMPTLSGAYLLPSILSQIIFATVSGFLGIVDLHGLL